MKLTNFYENGDVHAGAVTEEGVTDLTAAVKACNCNNFKVLDIKEAE